MCGITGFFSPRSRFDADQAERKARLMSDSIRHRGPDGSGVWIDAENGIALSHRRLSILDLSEAGAQPMSSASGRFVVSFNGEIYNHLNLREQIIAKSGPIDWRGSSDTETLLAAVDLWGAEETLTKLEGMFALALWDRQDTCLLLARDRLGEKPLYYGTIDGSLVFGSELKPLVAFNGTRPEISERAVASFLKYSYVPSPLSIYKNVFKLPPAHFIRFTSHDAKAQQRPYWNIETVAADGVRSPFTGSDDDIRDQVEAVLSGAVRSQMISDVPLGAFLSGGVDSSLITALMVRQSSQLVKSFSIGFEDADFNEAIYAERIANHLGTQHRTFLLTETDALATIPHLPRIFDEPFADASQIPTIMLSERTREHVTVALSGDGGDEIFGGYNRYFHAPSLWNKARHIPAPARHLLGGGGAYLQSRINSGQSGAIPFLLDKMGLPQTSAKRLSKFGRAIGTVSSFDGFFDNLISTWPDYSKITSSPAIKLAHDFERILPSLTLAERMMVFDSLTYMPDDILVKVDRSAMASSLETRAPFVDVNVIEAAWKTPLRMKIEGRSGKLILKDILHRFVPETLFDRPKQGFSIPVDQWLRGTLHNWAGDHLNGRVLDTVPVIDRDVVTRAFDAHQSRRDNLGNQLWPVLMLLAWMEESH